VDTRARVTCQGPGPAPAAMRHINEKLSDWDTGRGLVKQARRLLSVIVTCKGEVEPLFWTFIAAWI